MLVAELDYNRRIGCEYEVTVPQVGAGTTHDVQQTFARVLSANGIRAIARDYSHEPVPEGFEIAVERDASVRGQSLFAGISWNPLEIKTRILSGLADWEAVVPRTLEIAKYLGARVNASTGFHIHVEFLESQSEPTKIRSLFNLIHRFEPLIYSVIAPSRRANGYSRPIPAERARALHGCRSRRCFERALRGWERHQGLNLTHVLRSAPRVEFRYHQGTLDTDKARHWVRFVNRLMAHAVTRNCQAATRQTRVELAAFDNFLMTIGMRSNTGIYSKVAPELRETAKYLRQRFKHFTLPANQTSGESPAAANDGEET